MLVTTTRGASSGWIARSAGALEQAVGDAQRPQQVLGHAAALGLPGVLLAEAAAITHQHQQRHPVELRKRDDAVDARQQPMVLHQHRRAHPGEMRPDRHPDPLLLLGQPHQRHLRVFLGQAHQVHQPGLGQHREQAHPAPLEGVVHPLRARHGNRHRTVRAV
jgi:hypothetical protein